jgi:uncharacterized membrane protein (UPF0127 family)
MRRLLAALATGALLAAGCGNGDASGVDPMAEARIATAGGDVTLRVVVADSAGERTRGLQGVTDLAADQGMAFLFDEPTATSFWMKDTPLPLSIAFWDANGRIVGLMDMLPCAADPCPAYRPDSSFVGALEANRGFFDEHGVRMGDRVAIVR